MSANGVREQFYKYPVIWRYGDGPTCSGGLVLGDNEVVLNGSATPDGLHIPLAELSSVEVGRSPADRLNGQRSLVLERNSRERVLVAALGGIGLLGEINDLIGGLRAERTASVRVAVILPIRPGTVEAASRLVAAGPPFEIEHFGLERHHVFVSEREVVFFFEGEDAGAAVDMLARSEGVLQAAVRWRAVLAGRPRLAVERFAWTAKTDEGTRES